MFRKSVLSVIVVLLSALFPASAQNYTTDAILKRTTGKIATLECSGIARTKKEAIEMAKKSVIYTYLYNGIDGLNDNKPLLGSKPSAGAAQYVGQLLGTTRYANYIRSCTIANLYDNWYYKAHSPGSGRKSILFPIPARTGAPRLISYPNSPLSPAASHPALP